MSNFRIRPREHFTQIRNAALRDTRLSLKAKGLLALMLTFSDEWEYSLAHMMTFSTDGKDATYGAATELEQAGYLIKEQPRIEGGKLGKVFYYVSDEILTASGFSASGLTASGKPAPKNTDTKNTDTKKEKDMSASADASPESEAYKAEKGRAGGQGVTPSLGKVTNPPSTSTGTDSKNVPGGASALDDMIKAVVDLWNSGRGSLPAVGWPLSPKRASAVRAWVKGVGVERAADIWKDAVEEVSKDKHWIDNRYGLDNLLRHAEQKAEMRRAKKAGGASANANGYNRVTRGGYR